MKISHNIMSRYKVQASHKKLNHKTAEMFALKNASYIVVVRQGLVNSRDALRAHKMMQILRQSCELFIFLLLPLRLLSLFYGVSKKITKT